MEMAPYSTSSEPFIKLENPNEDFMEDEEEPNMTIADRLMQLAEEIPEGFEMKQEPSNATPTIEINGLQLDLESIKKLEAYEIIKRRDALRQKASRERETPEQRAKRLERERTRVREKRRQETPEQREKRLSKARERVRLMRANETPEQREKRLKSNLETTRRSRKERKEIYEAFTRASRASSASLSIEGIDTNPLFSPQPQEILNQMLENSMMQQGTSTPLNHFFDQPETSLLSQRSLQNDEDIFFVTLKNEFQELHPSQKETAKMKLLEALLMVKHGDNLLT